MRTEVSGKRKNEDNGNTLRDIPQIVEATQMLAVANTLGQTCFGSTSTYTQHSTSSLASIRNPAISVISEFP